MGGAADDAASSGVADVFGFAKPRPSEGGIGRGIAIAVDLPASDGCWTHRPPLDRSLGALRTREVAEDGAHHVGVE